MHIAQLLPRFRHARRALAALAERETWSRQQIEAWQLERINRLWHAAVRQTAHYRALARTSKLPEQFSSLEQFSALVPRLDKELVRLRPDDFLADQPAPGRWRSTSGSTGAPTRIYASRDAHQEMLYAKYRFQAMWGIGVFDRCAFHWGRAGIRGRIAWLRQLVKDRLRNRLRLSAYDLSTADLETHLRRLAAFRPQCLYGFSQAIYRLAVAAQSHAVRLPGLKLCILTAEPASERMLATIAAAFAAPVVVEYGATECGLIACHWPDGTFRVREDLVYLETLPREDGRFDLVLTNLAEGSFPLLRYAVADVSDAPLVKPEASFAILGRVTGRSDDLLVTGSGRLLHPARVDLVFESGQFPGVARYQVRQAADGAVAVLIERTDATTPLDARRLAAEFEGLLEGYAVRLEFVDAVPLTTAGKHRAVMSELAHARSPTLMQV